MLCKAHCPWFIISSTQDRSIGQWGKCKFLTAQNTGLPPKKKKMQTTQNISDQQNILNNREYRWMTQDGQHSILVDNTSDSGEMQILCTKCWDTTKKKKEKKNEDNTKYHCSTEYH